MNVLSLFDGMSCGHIALDRLGIKVDNYYSCEIDKFAIKVTQANYPKTIQLGDIKKLEGKSLPKIDLIIGGSPCQSFSIAGDNTGFEGKSGLFWEYERILREVKPKYFLFENVQMKKVYQETITVALGVDYITINSSLQSAQNRTRLYWTNIPNIKQPKDKNIKLSSILENLKFDREPYEEKYKVNRAVNVNEDKFPTLRAKAGSKTRGIGICDNGGYWRKLTPTECERLQTVPIGYTNHVSKTQRFTMLGNGWTVDIVAHILKNIKDKV